MPVNMGAKMVKTTETETYSNYFLKITMDPTLLKSILTLSEHRVHFLRTTQS